MDANNSVCVRERNGIDGMTMVLLDCKQKKRKSENFIADDDTSATDSSKRRRFP